MRDIKINWLLLALIIVVSSFLIPTGEAVTTITLSVKPEKVPAIAGKNTSFDIYIDGVTEAVVDLYAWELSVNWTDSYFDFVSAAQGPFLKKDGARTIFMPAYRTQTAGNETIVLACSITGDVPGVRGSGVLATVTVRVVEAIVDSKFDIFGIKLRNRLGNPIEPVTRTYDSRATAYVLGGTLTVDNPTLAYDNKNSTYAVTSYAKGQGYGGPGSFGFDNYNTPDPTRRDIRRVDFKASYQVISQSSADATLKISYWVDPSGTETVLRGPTREAAGWFNLTWVDQADPNGGGWDWTDVSNIIFKFTTDDPDPADTGGLFWVVEVWTRVTYSERIYDAVVVDQIGLLRLARAWDIELPFGTVDVFDLAIVGVNYGGTYLLESKAPSLLTSTNAWTNPDNVKVSDNAYASANALGKLEICENFGFTTPMVSIMRVEVGLEWYTTDAAEPDGVTLEVSTDGGISYSTLPAYTKSAPTSEALQWFDVTDAFPVWMPAMLTNANFKLKFSYYRKGTTASMVYIDLLQVKVSPEPANVNGDVAGNINIDDLALVAINFGTYEL